MKATLLTIQSAPTPPSPPTPQKNKEQMKKQNRKNSVTYNIYTKCKEALHNIMLFFPKIVVQRKKIYIYHIHASTTVFEENSGPTLWFASPL